MAELGAFFGNPNLQRQGARARALAAQRDVNTLADPRTYAVVQGLLGTAPDEMGFSVLNPDYEKIRKVAEPAFALGLLGQASPLLAPMTKGLPVGASIKNVGKFDVVKRDASDIFGEGAQRIRYTDPKSSGSIEVLARPDGTASVLSLEVPEKFRGKKIGESLQKQVLEDFPDMQGQVSSKAAATTAYRLGRRPPNMPDATLKDVHKMIDEDSSVNMISPQMQQRISPSVSYPQQEALDTAQRNAALPIEEGGLGLPKDNTPEMRAQAMGFDLETYHGTNDPNISSIDINKSRPDVQYMQGFFTSDDPNIASNYGDILMPFLQQKGTTVLERRAARQAGLEVPEMDTIYDKEKNILVTNNPSNIRSRFAAFDPMRRNEPDILAGVLPLGLLADEEQRKKLYELMPSLLGQ